MIRGIRKEVEEKLSSLKKDTTYLPFCQHEWNAHVKCRGFSQREYFEKALKLFDEVKLLEHIEKVQLGKLLNFLRYNVLVGSKNTCWR